MAAPSAHSVAAVGRRSEAPPAARPTLVLDVDGALLRTDMLHEIAIAYIKANPLRVFTVLRWMLQGKAVLKRKLSEAHELDVESLPVNTELEAYARAEHEAGRQVVLATAADELVAIRLARRFDFVSEVIASDGVTNLKGENKARALRERFPDGFVYAADSRSDLEVWKHADGIILAGAKSSVEARAKGLGKPVIAEFARPKAGLRVWAKALRIHQWAKNALVFVPLVLGGRMLDPTAWFHGVMAFLALGTLASATYLINDLWDLRDDRRHWTKRNRPLASGKVSVAQAVTAMPVLFALSLVLGALAGPPALFVLAAYLGLTLAYSFGLKRKPVLDAFTLAVLFTLRLVMGIVVVDVVASPWLLVFSMFLFASLSFAKRQTEVQRTMESEGRDPNAKIGGRGYFEADLPFILAIGVACGMASIMIMVLYLTQDALLAGFYRSPVYLWAIPGFLFLWLSRIWLICQRGELHDDPVVFATRDPKSLMLCAAVGVSFAMAWLGFPTP